MFAICLSDTVQRVRADIEGLAGDNARRNPESETGVSSRHMQSRKAS
jgi:hypothetical protein